MVIRAVPGYCGKVKWMRLRSGLVRTESLAALARQAGYQSTLRLWSKGEKKHGGRERDSNLCGTL
jgi:dsRNA-specific ribonuclease